MIDSSQTLLIGVDGGGTGCRAAIGTVTNGIVARAVAGPANATTDPAQAIANTTLAITQAARSIGISQDHLRGATVHIGLAGVMAPADSTQIAAALPYRHVTVTDDRPTTVRGALGEDVGFVLSIGTGTIIASQTALGIKCVSGWGFQLSDHGSGAWLGRAALERVLLCHDGVSSHSPMTLALLKEFNSDPNAIVTFGATAKAPDFAAFAPEIIAHAQDGDECGRDILQAGLVHLKNGLAALGFQAGDRLCLTGGVGPHYAAHFPVQDMSGFTPSLGTALDGAFALAKSHDALLKGTP